MRRFRDTKTGRFASERKWRRAKSRGSNKIVREIFFPKKTLEEIKEEEGFVGGSAGTIKTPKTIHDWERYYGEATDFEDTEEIEGGADY